MLTRRTFLFSTGAGLTMVLVAAALGVPALGVPPAAAQSGGAAAFIQSTGNRLLTGMKTAGGTDARRQVLLKIINETVDVDGVARFCLGRFWRIATPEQQQEYLTLFRRSLIKSITVRLGDYQDVTLAVGRVFPMNEDTAVDSTVTAANKAPVNVQWVVANEGGSFKVIDVIAEGTSLRQTQRSDYTSFIDGHGGNVQVLIDAMKRQDAS